MTVLKQSFRAVVAALCLVLVAPSAHSTALRTPERPLQNPFMAPNGMAAMHADSGASDTTPHPGPGLGPIEDDAKLMGGICPTVVAGADAMPMVICLAPVVGTTISLLDPDSNAVLATLTLPRPLAGNDMGGAYAYVDQADRLVTVDGRNRLLRIAHERGTDGTWSLRIVESTDLSPAIDSGCGEPGCNGVNSLAPDWDGRVWFATKRGTVGTVDTPTGPIHTMALSGEEIDNSIATAPEGTAVVTDRALYLLTADNRGRPHVSWRQPYDRGTARKPGQLSWGSGTTPTFFGPGQRPTQYVAIVDNAEPHAHLEVRDSLNGGLVCRRALMPGDDHSGTEVSVVAHGASMVVMNTYGYPFPPLDNGLVETRPPAAPYTGGLSRFDVDADGRDCREVWTNRIPIVAAPRLSLADGLLYAVAQRSPVENTTVTPVDSFEFTALDMKTGETLVRHSLAWHDVVYPITINLVVNHDGTVYQGTADGFIRISSREQ